MVGKQIGRYHILSRIGQGGVGTVYKAQDTKLNRLVALKFLMSIHSDRADMHQRFIQEAIITSSLQHPNICTIFDTGETEEGNTFIAMDYYKGETLQARLKRGFLSLDEVFSIILHIASGLRAAHDKGIVHRDIKPSNIFLLDNSFVKILDFGIAKIQGSELTKTGITLGTISYMSPEQTRGGKVDRRADIWSLGVMLYEMITGEPLFSGDDVVVLNMINNHEPPPLRNKRPEVSEELESAIQKALEKDVENRFQRMEEFEATLRRAYNNLRSSAGPFPKTAVLPVIEEPLITSQGHTDVVATIQVPAQQAQDYPPAGASSMDKKPWIWIGSGLLAILLLLFVFRNMIFDSIDQPPPAVDSEQIANSIPEAAFSAPPESPVEQGTEEETAITSIPEEPDTELNAGSEEPDTEIITGSEEPETQSEQSQPLTDAAVLEPLSPEEIVSVPAPNESSLPEELSIIAEKTTSGQVEPEASLTEVLDTIPQPDPSISTLADEEVSAELVEEITPLDIDQTTSGSSNSVALIESFTNSTGIEFKLIQPGWFNMGSRNGNNDEHPVRAVTVSQPFYMGVTEVTHQEWESLMNHISNPKKQGTTFPVASVSWHDANKFISALNERGDEYVYRLPTEAEWEYACRSGTNVYYYPSKREVAEFSWYKGNSKNKSQLVKSLSPNGWGLYDMTGNVWEWTADWYKRSYYTEGPDVDPPGPATGETRVLRGGAFNFSLRYITCSNRRYYREYKSDNNIGFRVVAVPK
ncbi:MAG: SUMF1/EgtB/PvdO family nonheme iron enzyme [Rhodothermaceae bacterium]|nr:SUMF1/EgtB/PvdO family nonheme iron enzyme [Rhodothermaceae bacterium]